MAKKNLLNTLQGLFSKVDETESRYMKALENKEDELIELQAVVQEKETMLTDMHKAKLLGDISEEAYNTAKGEVDVVKEKLQEVQREVQLIQEYKTDDIHAVIAEIETNASEYNAKQRKEIEKMQLEMLEAKLAYVEKMAEVSERYYKAIEPASKLQELKVQLGLQVRNYTSGCHDALNFYGTASGGHEDLYIKEKTVYDALSYGRIPYQLQKIVNQGKEKGLLK
ncbi:hypothetical protein ABET51_12850 [Metabacillus fastidiosus]|uniref:hypothetical protein n=1 Tax=Metabacillus fastidiosus TaxID=1458 RepID=UPI003D26BD21